MRIDKINTSISIQPATAQPANSRRSNSGLANVSQLVDLAIQKKGIRGDINLSEGERKSRLKGLDKLSAPINQSVAAAQTEKLADAMVESIKDNQTEIENATKPVEGGEAGTAVKPDAAVKSDASVKPDAANVASPAPAADAGKSAEVRAAQTVSADGTPRPSSLGQNIDTHA